MLFYTGWFKYLIAYYQLRHSGGFSIGVPPLPIPNREVKPNYVDGTARQRGRVDSRRF